MVTVPRFPGRLISLLFARPRLLLRVFALAILACTLGTVAGGLAIPLVSVTVTMDQGGRVRFTGDGQGFSVPGRDFAIFSNAEGDERVAVRAAFLPNVSDPRGTRIEVQRYWAARDRLSAMFGRGPVRIDAGGRHLVASQRPRMLSSLPPSFWFSLISGALAALAGLWVWTLRPLLWAPFMFALSGVGLFGGCLTIALNSVGGLALSGMTGQLLMTTNTVSALICAGTLVALFARFPEPLVSRRLVMAFAGVHLITAVVVPAGLFDTTVDIALSLAAIDSVAIILLVALQAWRSRRDEMQRRLLQPIAIGTAIAVSLFLVFSLAGQINGGLPILLPEMTAPLFLLIYLGLGLSIIRLRLFALGSWALSLLLSACAILLFLILDPIVLATITHERDLALLIAAFMGIAAYLPAREWLLRRAERLREGQMRDLLDHATQVALALSPTDAGRAWRAAVKLMFDPLEINAAPLVAAGPEVSEAGTTLHLPSPGGRDGLILRYPGGGTRLFTPDDVAAAQRFATLVASIIEAREAYMRGVTEERGRIARDLHDDVSARLLTSLHRADPAAMQEDVRGAMADIRAIITGLSGQERTLDSLMADLRHETQNRLNAAGITLDWPVNLLSDNFDTLDQGCNRHIISVVRETITNVLRHARATRVMVTVSLSTHEFSLEVRDNGIGLQRADARGNGLTNAERRMAEMGGQFEIVGTDRGTRVRITLPIAVQACAGSSQGITLR